MSDRMSVRVPATCANLGCLFDCGAIALGLYLNLHVTARADDKVVIHYKGVHADRVALDSSNLIARTLRETLDSWGYRHGFELEIENQIPIGAGAGSSAAAIVGALTASHWLADRMLTDEELVWLATRREGHPDNVAAAWHGGFTVAAQDQKQVFVASCPVPDSLGLILVVPDYALPTKEARRVLPEQITRADAVHNLQRAAVLTAQLFAGKAEFHRFFFDDRWHQPCRTPLVPGLGAALELKHPDLMGICLSGAGPSILAFARANCGAIGKLIKDTLAGAQVSSEVYVLAADNRGAKGWSMPV